MDRQNDAASLERLYTDNPTQYRRKVAGLVALGYGYLGLLIAVALGVTIGGVVLFASGTISVLYLDNFIKGAIPSSSSSACCCGLYSSGCPRHAALR
jgi:hypothetical protein